MFYAGTEREIRVGDEIIGIGVVDNYRVDGLLARVERVLDYDGRYAISANFYPHPDARFTRWSLPIGNFRYAGDISVERVCNCCGAKLPKKRVFSSLLYRNTGACDCCLAKELRQVHGYHFAKSLRYKIDADKITLGAEIEIDGEYDNAPDTSAFVRDMVDYALENNLPLAMTFERDGSLSDGGVECVTAPLTIHEWTKPDIKRQFNALFDTADEYGFNFHENNNAGLHVHIGRKSLCGTDRQISDAVGLLMGWAVTRLWDNGFRDLAGRDVNSYCHPLNATEDGDEYGGTGLTDTYAMHDRYCFVNIQNDKTIELRVFNRATCYSDVLVAIDTCYMLAKWAVKKINVFLKRNSYSAKSKNFTDALAYADRISWDALVKYSKYPEITLPRMREAGINV